MMQEASAAVDKPAGIDFLDFLFTVAISVGLTPEILDESGLLSEPWQQSGYWVQEGSFHVAVFTLGLSNLVLSWFGYHASIAKKPLNYTSLSGMFRFLMDVLLVVMYGVMLILYKNFAFVLALLLSVHFLFVVWDVLKIIEHPDKYAKEGRWIERYRREFVSLFACATLVATGFLYYTGILDQWTTLWACILMTFFYRVNKYYPIWEWAVGYRVDRYA